MDIVAGPRGDVAAECILAIQLSEYGDEAGLRALIDKRVSLIPGWMVSQLLVDRADDAALATLRGQTPHTTSVTRRRALCAARRGDESQLPEMIDRADAGDVAAQMAVNRFVGAERWVSWVREADALLVDGGDATYLCHWMRNSGLADLLPSLPDTVWVGVSAGSMVMTPRIGEYFVEWASAPDDRGLGVVDFSIFPHLDAFPTNTLADAERWAAGLDVPAYAIDEQTAIKVVGGAVAVVSEGKWVRFGG